MQDEFKRQKMPEDRSPVENLKHFLEVSPAEAAQMLKAQPEALLSEEALELMRERLALFERAYERKMQAQTRPQDQPLETESLDQQPKVESQAEATSQTEPPPIFLDSQEMASTFQEISPHWEQMFNDFSQISPENLDMMLQILHQQVGFPKQQIEQFSQTFAAMKQLDPDMLQQVVGRLSELPPETLAQLGQATALFSDTQNFLKQAPATPPLQAQGLADSSQQLFRQEMSSLPLSQQQRLTTVASNSLRLMQQKDFQQLITLHSEVLSELADTPVPHLRAMFHLGRAQAYLNSLESNPRAFTEAGLADCDAALATLTRTQTPMNWAQAYLLRGTLYSNRQNGIRSENLKLALADLDTILQHFSYETLPGIWVMARGWRGMIMQEFYKSGEEQNAEQAISDIEAALEHLSFQETPEFWAALKAAATQAYMLRYSYTGDRTKTLEQIIQDCDDALKVATRERLPREWALLHQIRGLAYIDRGGGDARQNREQAIADCQQALTVFTREQTAYDWAATHMYLGTAYLLRAQGNREQNLKEALQHYDSSLQVFTHEAYPQEWAKTIANRNTVANELGVGDRPITQEEGLTNFAAALEQLDPQEQPISWATLHINWGNSYLNRIQGLRETNMQQAIDHYNQALTVLTPRLNPILWALTLVNRAMAKRGSLPQKIVNLFQGARGGYLQGLFTIPLNETMAEVAAYRVYCDEAIADLQAALTVFTREETPREWAQAHRELAGCYDLYMWGNRQEYQAKAREHFAAADSVLSHTSTPQEWAVMQMNRGLGLLAQPSQDVQTILGHFDAALTVFTSKVAPANYRRVQMVRAFVFERLERWEDAHQALLGAREVQRDLVATALSDQSQSETLAEMTFTNMYVYDAQILLLMNPPDPVEAVISLEEGRAQSMRATLEMDNYAQKKQQMRDPAAKKRLEAFLDARNAWRKHQHQAIEPLPEHLSATEKAQKQEQRHQALETAYLEFVQARAAIRLNDDPDFMTPLPTLERIARALTGSDEALVYLTAGFRLPLNIQPIIAGKFVDGLETGFALIVTRQVDGTPEVQALSLAEMSTNAIDALLKPVPRQKSPENAEAETEVVSDTVLPLNINIEKVVQTLGTLGLNKLAATLYARGVRKMRLVPYGYLGLFPLAAVRIQIPGRPASHLGELFELTFVPSARAAEMARERTSNHAKKPPALLTGGNPQPLAKEHDLKDLPFATAEANTVHHLARKAGYPSARLHYLAPHEMTKEAVATRMQEVTYAHLALHGIYHINSPRSSVLMLAGTKDLPVEKRTISLGQVLDGKIDLHNLRLLVLSACETSTFDIQRLPNEVIGLATGFLQAGVAGVIASLWPADDEATYLLMTRFARLYLDPQGLWSPAQALAQAQRWLREEATNAAILQEYELLLPEVLTELDQILSPQQQRHLERIRPKAKRLALTKPDELPYAHPNNWAGFIVTGC